VLRGARQYWWLCASFWSKRDGETVSAETNVRCRAVGERRMIAPASAQLVGEAVHVLEDGQSGRQPGR